MKDFSRGQMLAAVFVIMVAVEVGIYFLLRSV